MASSSDGGAANLPTPDTPDGRNDTTHDALSESGSSYISSDESVPRQNACAWRTAEFYDQECSRYFDCPTHLVERSLSDSESSSDEDGAASIGDTEPGHAEGEPDGNFDDGQHPRLAIRSDSTSSDPESSPRTPVDATSRASGTPTASNSDLPSSSQPRETSVPHPSLPERTSSLQSLPSLPPNLSEAPNTPPPAHRTSPTYRHPDIEVHHAPEPPQSPSSSRRRPSGPPRNFSDILLPRWQPDSEVTFCPICRTQFSFFVRKHHCRKCGRVVCNACSPHRITIPHQYIVRQPGQARASQLYSNPLMGDDGLPYVSGGERVRLCNPCVPDPNTTPPLSVTSPTQRSPRPHYRSQSNLGSGFGPFSPGASTGFFLQGPAHESYPRGRSVTMNAPAPPNSGPRFASTRNQILAGTPPAYYPTPSSQYPGSRLRYRPLRDPASASSSTQRPLPPTPQIAEEDECPVCHRELPSRTLPNYESLRESHINGCITAHSTYGSGMASAPNLSEGEGPSVGSPAPVRRTGIFPYVATEKDCVDSAECTICLEEFEVGVRMARLECLCRFHHRCISAWFVNHPGRCPVHQHDSYGY